MTRMLAHRAGASPEMICIVVRLQDDLVAEFRWVRGHADILRWFADAALFDATVNALAEPFVAEGVTKVVGSSPEGFFCRVLWLGS
jgi:hypothetical protein